MRCLALGGAEVILAPFGISDTKKTLWRELLATRAFENISYVLAANNIGYAPAPDMPSILSAKKLPWQVTIRKRFCRWCWSGSIWRVPVVCILCSAIEDPKPTELSVLRLMKSSGSRKLLLRAVFSPLQMLQLYGFNAK